MWVLLGHTPPHPDQAPKREQRAIPDSPAPGWDVSHLPERLFSNFYPERKDLSLSQIACVPEMQRMTIISTFQSCVCHRELSQSDPCWLCSHNLERLAELSLTSGTCHATSYPCFAGPNYFLVWEDSENMLELFIQPL